MLVDADDEPLDTLPDEDMQDSMETETEKGAAESVAQEYRFYESSRLAIGDDEYKIDPDFWAEQFRRDFEIIQERLKMEQEALQAGSLVSEPDLSDLETPVFHWERVGGLRLVSLEQFILESNQGIFREDRFYCDKGRGWLKKTVGVLNQHGYPHARKVEVDGRWLIEVSKNPMGEL